MGETPSLNVDDNAHVDARNEVLVDELIHKMAAAVGVCAAKNKINIRHKLPDRLLQHVALFHFHLSIWNELLNHSTRDVNLGPPDIRSPRSDNPIEVRFVQ